jgi:chromosomal replication initiator protein
MTVVLSLWRGQILVTVRSAREIIAEVAEAHGFTPADLASPVRTKQLSAARQEAMWACRQVKGKDGKPRYSYPFIGRLFGGRDHTTVLWGERQHAARLAGERVAA